MANCASESKLSLPSIATEAESTPTPVILMGDTTVDEFHRLYYSSGESTWGNTFWFGSRVLKCPLDLWVYQELIAELRPELIVETGTYAGGSALFLASMCDLASRGEVITIDIRDEPGRPVHPRITYLTGSSISESVIAEVGRRASGRSPVMVILDSDHTRDHVEKELAAYANPYTGKPMEFDPKTNTLFFLPKGTASWTRELKARWHDRVAVAL